MAATVIKDACLHEGTNWDITIPSQALAPRGSVYCESKNAGDVSELFSLSQKVAQFWEHQWARKGWGANYFFYTSSQEKGWEIVPYPPSYPSGYAEKIKAWILQFQVTAAVVFGKFSRTSEVDPSFKKKFQSFQVQSPSTKVQQIATDAFCDERVINSQGIWEGTHIQVLYNYKPLGKEGLHFLLVTKEHKERFTELSLEEFQEKERLAAALIKYYSGYTWYRYHKTGRLAGQSEPHFHEHVVFVQPQDEFWSKLSLFVRMIFPSWPLHPTELAKRVKHLKEILNFPRRK